MKHYFILVLCCLSFTIAQKKYALIIGVNDYNENYASKLKNCINDANSISTILEKMGFEVTTLLDPSRNEIKDETRNIGSLNLGKDDVVLFYFSGHGSEKNGKNYLMPSDIATNDPRDYKFDAISTNWVQERLEETRAQTKIIILDACRYGFNRVGKKSSEDSGNFNAMIVDTDGTFIAYATSPNGLSSDGTGTEVNGLYTKHLINVIMEPKLKIEDIFKKVRKLVIAESNGDQIPWESSSLTEDFYFTRKKIRINEEELIASNDEILEVQETEDVCIEGDCNNGEGTMLYANGIKLKSNWIDGDATGYSYFTYPEGDFFESDIRNNEFYGVGFYTIPDIFTIEAEFNTDWKIKDNMANIYYVDGRVYKGELNTDWYPHGQGAIYLSKDNIFYEGTFKDGYPDCESQRGCIGDCQDGEGRWTYYDCSVYEGTFKNGIKHGKGVWFSKDASMILNTNWINGIPNGTAFYAMNSGDVYEGEIEGTLEENNAWDFKLQGFGTWTYSSRKYPEGHSMSGNWVDNGAHGEMIIVRDGKEYVQMFEYGEPIDE